MCQLLIGGGQQAVGGFAHESMPEAILDIPGQLAVAVAFNDLLLNEDAQPVIDLEVEFSR